MKNRGPIFARNAIFPGNTHEKYRNIKTCDSGFNSWYLGSPGKIAAHAAGPGGNPRDPCGETPLLPARSLLPRPFDRDRRGGRHSQGRLQRRHGAEIGPVAIGDVPPAEIRPVVGRVGVHPRDQPNEILPRQFHVVVALAQRRRSACSCASRKCRAARPGRSPWRRRLRASGRRTPGCNPPGPCG